MAKTKILIAVKTYPRPSNKYDETVCTAGFREDGSWIRIYPMPFRKYNLADQYKKWQWIEIDCQKNKSDFRPESFSPKERDIPPSILGNVITTKNNWAERKKYALKNVTYNITGLISDAKDPDKRVSLATYKPKEILDFYWEPDERTWNKKDLEGLLQMNLFEKFNTKHDFEVVKKLPYKFRYKFKDENNNDRDLSIEDWEIGSLFWNCLKSSTSEKEALEKVKAKYLDEFIKKDLYFFLGTTKEFHNVSPNPFIIIGVFYPPLEAKIAQLSLL